jgi:hypothetical protein
MDDRWVVEAGVLCPAKESKGGSKDRRRSVATRRGQLQDPSQAPGPRKHSTGASGPQRSVSTARNETLTVETLR